MYLNCIYVNVYNEKCVTKENYTIYVCEITKRNVLFRKIQFNQNYNIFS